VKIQYDVTRVRRLPPGQTLTSSPEAHAQDSMMSNHALLVLNFRRWCWSHSTAVFDGGLRRAARYRILLDIS